MPCWLSISRCLASLVLSQSTASRELTQGHALWGFSSALAFGIYSVVQETAVFHYNFCLMWWLWRVLALPGVPGRALCGQGRPLIQGQPGAAPAEFGLTQVPSFMEEPESARSRWTDLSNATSVLSFLCRKRLGVHLCATEAKL